MRRRELNTFLGGLATASAAWPSLFAAPALGQASYPSKPIRMVVPFPPGGAADVWPHHRRTAFRKDRSADYRVQYRRRFKRRRLRNSTPRRSRWLHHPVQRVSVRARQIRRRGLSRRSANRFPPDCPSRRSTTGAAGQSQRARHGLRKYLGSAQKEPKRYFFALSSGGSAGHIATLEFLRRTRLPLDTVLYKGSAPAIADLLSGSVRQSMAGLRTGRGLPKSLRPRTAEHLQNLPISDCRSIAGKITTPVSDETNRRWLAAANVSVDRRRYPMPGSRHRYFRSRRCRPDIWRHRSATQRTRR
jgi:Tripartite tricarboxylate transporter family receptor